MEEQLEKNIERTNKFFEKYGKDLSPIERDVIRLRFGMDDGRFRTSEELSELFGVEQKNIEDNIQNGIEKMGISFTGCYKLIYCIFAGQEMPKFHQFDMIKLAELCNNILETLDEEEKKVLELRTGLTNTKDYTLKETGEVLGITSEEAKQIEAKALRKLRHPNRCKVIYEYIKTLENNA